MDLSAIEHHFTWPRITEADERAVLGQLRTSVSIYDRSGVFARFEDRFARMHGRRHAVLFCTGTMSLFAAFSTLDLQEGDEVIVPDYTFFATVSPLVHFPCTVLFADCDTNGNVSPQEVERLLSPRTRAVVITHMWGVPAETNRIAALCTPRNIALIEDCSHAFGAAAKDRLVGTDAAMAIWSIQGQKTLTGGEGGIVVVDSDTTRDRLLLAGHYNNRCKKEISENNPLKRLAVTGFGLKLRAHPLAVALAESQFDRIDTILANRRRRASKWLKTLSQIPGVRTPSVTGFDPSWYAFWVLIEEGNPQDPAALHQRLQDAGLREADMPGSTRDISSFALFREDLSAHGVRALFPNAGEHRPNARTFATRLIKFPVWGYDDEEEISDEYLLRTARVLKDVPSGSA